MPGLAGLVAMRGLSGLMGPSGKQFIDDIFITDRITYKVVSVQLGSTVDFNRWITDRIAFDTYVRG